MCIPEGTVHLTGYQLDDDEFDGDDLMDEDWDPEAVQLGTDSDEGDSDEEGELLHCGPCLLLLECLAKGPALHWFK